MNSPASGSRELLGGVALGLYRGVGGLLAPAVGPLLALREKRGKEDPRRRPERVGLASASRPAGALVWVHAASVGETVAVLPLIERLAAEEGLGLLLTTGTVTSADIAGRRLGPAAIHQYAPVDVPAFVQRFLDHWKPDLAIFAESELWPTTMDELKRRGVPLVLVNARMSERSFGSWRRLRPVAAALMRRVHRALAQSLADAQRLRALGAADVVVCGNLKFDVPPPPVDEAELAACQSMVAGRSVLLAASTHPGEERAVIQAHIAARASGIDLLTVLAPRHPERGAEVQAEAAAAGLSSTRRAAGEGIGPEIYVADTIGEMGLWYRLADLAVMGGSLVPHGGQNPIEPAKLGAPILHGPHIGNFRDVYSALSEARAVRAFTDGASLSAVAADLLHDPRQRQRLAREARTCVARFTGALDRTMDALGPDLEALRSKHGAAAENA